jgi:hypothetical protein
MRWIPYICEYPRSPLEVLSSQWGLISAIWANNTIENAAHFPNQNVPGHGNDSLTPTIAGDNMGLQDCPAGLRRPNSTANRISFRAVKRRRWLSAVFCSRALVLDKSTSLLYFPESYWTSSCTLVPTWTLVKAPGGEQLGS